MRLPLTIAATLLSRLRHELYDALDHAAGQVVHGPGSMAWPSAWGAPSRGIQTKMRREIIPLRPSIPPTMGLVPWKSKRSQPSRFAARRDAWMAGSVCGLSISRYERRYETAIARR